MQTTFVAHLSKLMKLYAKNFILRMNNKTIIMTGAIMVHFISQATPCGCETQHVKNKLRHSFTSRRQARLKSQSVCQISHMKYLTQDAKQKIEHFERIKKSTIAPRPDTPVKSA